MRARRGEAAAFIAAAVAAETDDCIMWPFASTNGYGYGYCEGSVRMVHDYICERVHGPRPGGDWRKVHAAHDCNNRACINHRHLSWKTKAENEHDKVAIGRSNRGERCANHKLTAEQVLAIRADTRQQKEIAAEYGLRQQTVSDIKTRRNWRWLT